MFRHCPLLQPFADQAEEVYREFLAYKNRVPVRGAIMLNHAMDSVVMVRGWKSSSAWSFPRGKINKEEKDIDCAVREVYEETGYDIQAAGLVPQDEEHAKHIRKSLRGQDISLYVFRSVPEDTYFEPRTRKEIGKIDWFKIEHLPSLKKGPQNVPSKGGESVKESSFYNVVPFLQPLRSWISQQRRLDKQQKRLATRNTVVLEEDTTEVEEETPYIDGESEAPIEFDDVEADVRPNTDHFTRLLSGLANNAEREEVASVNLPEVSGAHATTEDLAAALKRMLSVGGPGSDPLQSSMPNSIPQEKEATANPLLHMLRGPQQTAPSGFLPPHTPAERILPTPAVAHTPHHNHLRQPQFPTGPPPGYGLNSGHGHPLQQPQGPRPYPQQPQQQFQYRHVFPQNGPPQYQMPTQPPQTFPIQGPSGFQPGLPQAAQSFANSGPPGLQRMPPAGLPQGPNVYQQIGHPQLATSYPQYDQNIVTPAASRLPPPKLTSHTLNLLNVFKSPAAQAAHPAHPIHMNRPSASGLEIPEPRATPPPAVPLSRARPVEFSSPEMAQPQAQKPRNQHQDALLNLFRSPSTPAILPPNLPPQQRKEPVELSAQSSPHIGHTRKTSGHQYPIQEAQEVQQAHHKLSMRRLPNLDTKSSQNIKHSPNLTSATVSGPLNAPDFATVRKNQKPAELGTGASPNTEAPPQQQQSFHPTAILPRAPQSQRQPQVQRPRIAPPPPSQTPPVPVHTVNGKTAMEAPRPFHPLSILKRQEEGMPGENEPKQEPKQPPPMLPGAVPLLPKSQMGRHPPPMLPGAVPLVPKHQMGPPPPYHQQKQSALPRENSFDRRDSAPAGQKSALLGLFAAKPSYITPTVPTQLQAPTSALGTNPVPSEQKQQLLSLFGPAKSAATAHAQNHGQIGSLPVSAYPGNASGVNSPVSPLPAHAAPVRSDTHNSAPTSAPNSVPLSNPNARTGVSGFRSGGFSGYNENDSRSRISSITSIPGGEQGRLSRKGASTLSGNVESGSRAQSPITPKEKNFLLDYLMGVAKEGDRNANSGR